jgi:hypothetical protein
MRAPLPALRRLYALGGAPAASHAVLSRAPSHERLLEPLARARVAHETSLDALARPLDVGKLLSRVTDAVEAREVPIEAATQDAATRRKVRARPPQPAAAVAREVLASSVAAPRPTRGGQPARDADVVRAAVARTFETHTVERTRMTTTAAADVGRAPRFDRPASSGPPRRDAPVSVDRAPAKATRIVHSIAADAGARARVVVGSAVPNIERLLAVATPSAATPKSRRAATQDASPRPTKTNDGAPAAKPQDVSRLLARAVDRASASVSTAPATHADWRPSPAAARPSRAPVADSAQRVTTQAVAPEIATRGGFKGLAQRTLVASSPARSAEVRRIEPEPRVPMDLTLDTLDTKVADSLARVLEREARRHGIDLAGAGA